LNFLHFEVLEFEEVLLFLVIDFYKKITFFCIFFFWVFVGLVGKKGGGGELGP
jgi:hypothetical protein